MRHECGIGSGKDCSGYLPDAVVLETAVVEHYIAPRLWDAGLQVYLILPHGGLTSNTVVICSE